MRSDFVPNKSLRPWSTLLSGGNCWGYFFEVIVEGYSRGERQDLNPEPLMGSLVQIIP